MNENGSFCFGLCGDSISKHNIWVILVQSTTTMLLYDDDIRDLHVFYFTYV